MLRLLWHSLSHLLLLLPLLLPLLPLLLLPLLPLLLTLLLFVRVTSIHHSTPVDFSFYPSGSCCRHLGIVQSIPAVISLPLTVESAVVQNSVLPLERPRSALHDPSGWLIHDRVHVPAPRVHPAQESLVAVSASSLAHLQLGVVIQPPGRFQTEHLLQAPQGFHDRLVTASSLVLGRTDRGCPTGRRDVIPSGDSLRRVFNRAAQVSVFLQVLLLTRKNLFATSHSSIHSKRIVNRNRIKKKESDKNSDLFIGFHKETFFWPLMFLQRGQNHVFLFPMALSDIFCP